MHLAARRFRRLFALAGALALLASACGDDSSSGGGGSARNIDVSGSSTVEPITSLVAESFNAENPDVGISVDGPGTGDGFELFCSGATDISDASRPIKDEEIEACEAGGIEYTELKVGIDGITVLTNPSNEAVDCIDIPGIYALVGPESTGFGDWSDASDLADTVGSDFGGDFPDEALDITGPGEESGTYDTFVELTIEGIAEEQGVDDVATRPDYTSSPNDNVIIEGITGSDSSFGWVGYAFFVNNSDAVKAIEVANEGTGDCVEPTDETISAGEYPLARDLFVYVNNANLAEKPELQSFLDFYINENLTTAVADAGYVVLSEDAIAETQSALATALG